jgi:threonine-phosphate decarboxylase
MELRMKKHIHGGNIYQYEGCLDFSANLNPLGLPQGVRDAVIESLDEASLYPQVGYAPLREAIAEYESVLPSQVICGNGAAELIYTLCRAARPKKALLAAPTFAEYEEALTSCGCEIRYVYLSEAQGFVLEDSFLDAVTEELDILFLCNPNNPTGALVPRSFLEKLLDRCRKAQVLMVVDECFLDFVPEPEAYTLKAELEKNENLFLLKAFTKRYAMAGIRLGYGLCANAALLEAMAGAVQPWNISVMAQAAGIAALREKSYVEAGRALVFEQAEILKESMKRMGLTLYASEANYIFFQAPEDFFEKTLEKGILIRDCSNYQGLGRGFFRIAVKTAEENEQLLRVFEEILKEEK